MGFKGVVGLDSLPRSGGILELPSVRGTDFEGISVDGHDVVVPHSCGGDRNEHRFGLVSFSPDGFLGLKPH